MSFAYKWEGDKTVKAYSLPDFNTYKKDPKNDRELVKKLWELMDEADVVVAHNGISFDIKKSNARFLYHGLKAPAPFKTVDTLLVARKYFKLTSNRLNDVCQHLGIGAKVRTGGLDLWMDCIDGKMEAWRKMVIYNKMDVILLESLYLRLRGWMATGHPNMGLYSGNEKACPVCGGTHVQKRGTMPTLKYLWIRLQCMDCGKWFKGDKIDI